MTMALELAADPRHTAYRPDDEVLKLLAEIGLSAAVRNGSETAAPIFAALALFQPDNPIITVGSALGAIAAGRAKDAIADLRQAGVTRDHGADQPRAVLLIALCLAGHQIDASLLCQHLLDRGDGPSRQIATRLKPVIDAGLSGGPLAA